MPTIAAYSTALRKNIEASGVVLLDWQVTQYFEHDAVYMVGVCPGNNAFPVDKQVLNKVSYSCGYDYYSGNYIVGNSVGAITVEELQTVLPIFATYQPAK